MRVRLLALLSVALAVGAAAVAASGAAPSPLRGAMVDVGGRRQHIVCEGPRDAPEDRSGPTVVFESGAFGVAADWAAVQAQIGGRYRSCAYDRAGLGASEPSAAPRDSEHIASELHALLAAAGERPPYVLVAHSMAPVHAYAFARRWPGEVAGLVLVDALPPVALTQPTVRRWVQGFADVAGLAPLAARLGLLRLAQGFAGDEIGLSGAAHAEKLAAFVSVRHNRWAAAEAALWPRDGAQARSLGPLDPAMPVAVVTPDPRGQPKWRALQALPALRSDRGFVEHAQGADHAGLLGPRYAAAVVRGIDFVRTPSPLAGEGASP